MVKPTVVISVDSLRMKRREYQHHYALHRLAELELARPNNSWTNVLRLSTHTRFKENPKIYTRTLFTHSTTLLKERLDQINLLRRLLQTQQEIQLKLSYLYACRNIWSLLSITGSDTKPKTRFNNDCPCCHYVAYETDSNLNTFSCTYCLLKDFAWNFECEIDDIDENRYRYWSYYEEWSRANSDYSTLS